MSQTTQDLPSARITLSLVSHTNVGKTTLARTLLRRDVGEVRDQAHVTEISEAYPLIELPEGSLLLWDTPGFGDSVRLLRRLRRHDRPVLWFVQQTWDRLTDRPLWCSQQAVLNVRDEADLVLYLVNAAEEPEEAGYVGPELDLLQWMGKPVLLLLNQSGAAGDRAAVRARRQAWEEHTARWDCVRGVYELDAFSRCWVQENLLLERLAPWLPESSRGLLDKLSNAWAERNLEVLRNSVQCLADYLASTALDREELQLRPSREDRRQAMERLGERLVSRTGATMRQLLSLHGLEGEAAVELEEQVEAYTVERDRQLEPERGAMLGGVVSGALGGLMADVLAGGLTFGGGLVAGAILGALGGAGLARGYQMVKGERRPAVSWSQTFMDRLTQQALVRYLAVAHFGRGRGEFREVSVSRRWGDHAQEVLGDAGESWARLWKSLAKERPEASQAASRLRQPLDQALRQVLVRGYPEASRLLGTAVAQHVGSQEAMPDDR